MKRFQPYPAYKDSGVEWLGEIPVHWEVKRLKHLTHVASGFAPPKSYDRSLGEYPVYGSNGIIGYCDEYFITEETITVGRVGASGSVNIVPPRSWVSDNALLLGDLRPAARLPWLRYVLQGMNLGLQAAKNAQPIITGSFLGDQALAVPPLPEQRAIAAFLDRETAKIDALVAKKERLIELLQEKRTALISHAVTKGLDPTVPMKDSGVEWLGKIPAHWEVKPLKFTVTMNPDVLDEGTNPDYEILYIDVGNVDSTGAIQGTESLRFENAPTRARRKVRAGDTILSTVRTYLKAIAFMTDPPDNLIVSTGFAVLRPGQNADPKFVWRLVQSQHFVDAVVSHSEGVGYPAINPSRLGRLVVWLPPLPEQRAIAAFLDRETARIDALVAKVREAIERLKELRTALISAAVTGKIDVREAIAA